MTTWLNRFSFQDRITLPESVRPSTFNDYLTDLEEDWLLRLIGPVRMLAIKAWLVTNPYGQSPTPNEPLPGASVALIDPMKALYDRIVPFLVYAVYAEYVLEGGAIATETGIVEKERENSEALTDAHRSELYRRYKNRAESRAAKLAEFLKQNDCELVRPTYDRPAFTTVGGTAVSVKDQF
jgi:hypothetical protein